MNHKSLLLALTALLPACSNIDCPLNNVVEMHCGLYDSPTAQSKAPADTLSVEARAAGRDTVLLNRLTGKSAFALPLRLSSGTDTLLLRLSGADGDHSTDTLYLQQHARPHFENMDCPATCFHTLTTLRLAHGPRQGEVATLDSVVLARPEVDYEQTENVKLYLSPTAL